jgi:hypothetical protein
MMNDGYSLGTVISLQEDYMLMLYSTAQLICNLILVIFQAKFVEQLFLLRKKRKEKKNSLGIQFPW